MNIFKPDFRFTSVLDITPDFLRQNGIAALLLDIDNTLSHHFSQTPIDGLDGWLGTMSAAGIKTVLFSNARESRVAPFAERIGVGHITKAMKPLPFGMLRARRLLGVKLKNTAIVGDQLFTDMLGGNISGAKTILVTPMHEESGRFFKLKRRLERMILR